MRAAFLGQTVRQLLDLEQLLRTGDPVAAPTVAHEVGQIAEAAVTFGLPEVEGAARAAVDDLEAGADKPLHRLARAVRDAGGQTRFPPIVVIAREPLLGKLQVEASRCCETLEFYPTVAAWYEGLRGEHPEAIVTPLDEVAQLTEEDRGRAVFVYGGSGHDLNQRAHAASLGAKAFLPDRVEFRPLLDRVRSYGHALRAGQPRVLLIVVDNDRLRDHLTAALEQRGAQVSVARRSDEIGPMLRESSPDLLVVGERADRFGATDLAAAARMVPRQADLSVVAVGQAASATRLIAGGCDAAVDSALPVEDVATQVWSYLERARARATGRDASTGLVDRSTLLRAADRALSDARRGGRPLSVAIVEIDGAAELQRRLGRGAGDVALRLLARCLEGACRASDVVGRLDEDGFLVLMPSCPANAARKRLGDVRALFSALCARDDRLAGLTFSAGVANTDDGVDRLLIRAEETLERGRARDARGTIA